MSPEAAQTIEATPQDTYFLDRVDAARRQLARTGNQDDFQTEVDSLITSAVAKAALGELGDYSADDLRVQLRGVGKFLQENPKSTLESDFLKKEITRNGKLREALVALGSDGEEALKRFAASFEQQEQASEKNTDVISSGIGHEAVTNVYELPPELENAMVIDDEFRAMIKEQRKAEAASEVESPVDAEDSHEIESESEKLYNELTPHDKDIIEKRRNANELQQKAHDKGDFQESKFQSEQRFKFQEQLSPKGKEYLMSLAR